MADFLTSIVSFPAVISLGGIYFTALLFCVDRDHSVTITHDVRSQKSAEPNRYHIDYSAQRGLRDELQKG